MSEAGFRFFVALADGRAADGRAVDGRAVDVAVAVVEEVGVGVEGSHARKASANPNAGKWGRCVVMVLFYLGMY